MSVEHSKFTVVVQVDICEEPTELGRVADCISDLYIFEAVSSNLKTGHSEMPPSRRFRQQLKPNPLVIADFVLLSDLKVRYEASGQIGNAKDFKRLVVAFFTNASVVEPRYIGSAGSCVASPTK